MKPRLCSMDRVVSMEEIDDYVETRGRWNGRRFELASTPAKKIALLRALAAIGLIRAGWASLALLAAQPVTVALVLGVSLLAHTLPAVYPRLGPNCCRRRGPSRRQDHGSWSRDAVRAARLLGRGALITPAIVPLSRRTRGSLGYGPDIVHRTSDRRWAARVARGPADSR